MAAHEQYFADEKSRKAYMVRTIISKVLIYAFLTLFALFMLAPFILMIVGSFINAKKFEHFSNFGTFTDFAFKNWTWQNYKDVLDANIKGDGNVFDTGFPAFFLNTFIVAVCSTTVTVVTAVLAGFAFARLEFKGKEAIFSILLATMMIPGEMMVITNVLTVRAFKWMNTFKALILVHGVSVFYVFYLRQTFQQIPNELYLAAKVDGVSDFGYLWKVMIPIAMPTITTIIILSMMGSWNSYIWPNMVAPGTWTPFQGVETNHSMMLVSNGLRELFASANGVDTKDATKIAGSVVISMPLFIVFACFRKYIMSGVSRSGIKG